MSLLIATLLALTTPQVDRQFPQLGLTLTLPPMRALPALQSDESLTIDRGELHGHTIEIATHVISCRRFQLDSAEDLTDLYVTSLRTRGRAPVCSHDLVEPSYRGFWKRASDRAMHVSLQRSRLTPGPYGIDPFAAELEGSIIAEPTHWPRGGTLLLKGAVLAEAAYLIEVSCSPPASDRLRKTLQEFFTAGVRYTGATRDPLWIQAEVRQRWRACRSDPPSEVRPKVLRTAHYIVIGDASFGRALGRSLERTYRRIQDEFPFPEWPGRRLMPVFLFRQPRDYQRFSAREGVGGRGHARGDYFATWYESPADPVLVHEAVHQIFANRLRLPGGGSWFHEGVAEYLARATWEHADAAREIARQGPVPFNELIGARRLTETARADTVRRRYQQAGLLMAFLRTRAPDRDRFQELITSIGSLPPGNTDQIDGALLRLYGTDLAHLEQTWLHSLHGH